MNTSPYYEDCSSYRRSLEIRLVRTFGALRDMAVLGAVGRLESEGYPDMMAVSAVARKLGWRPRQVMEAINRAINPGMDL